MGQRGQGSELAPLARSQLAMDAENEGFCCTPV